MCVSERSREHIVVLVMISCTWDGASRNVKFRDSLIHLRHIKEHSPVHSCIVLEDIRLRAYVCETLKGLPTMMILILTTLLSRCLRTFTGIGAFNPLNMMASDGGGTAEEGRQKGTWSCGFRGLNTCLKVLDMRISSKCKQNCFVCAQAK